MTATPPRRITFYGPQEDLLVQLHTPLSHRCAGRRPTDFAPRPVRILPGAAYQIQDDVLNLVGDGKKYGKEIGCALLEGKRTLILAHLFKTCDGAGKRRSQTFFGKPRPERAPREVAWVLAALHRHGSIDQARQAARDFAGTARAEFEKAYRDAPSGPM
jgi:geranylgeranyl diphosphate synthase type II